MVSYWQENFYNNSKILPLLKHWLASAKLEEPHRTTNTKHQTLVYDTFLTPVVVNDFKNFFLRGEE
jgi:hypothetical protein